MANWFIERQAAKLGVPTKPLSEQSRDALAAHDWPGNVRELQNVIERVWSCLRAGAAHHAVCNRVITDSPTESDRLAR